ncbi:unnamed protein product [Acanthoscelides obtectus]|uniref:DDRGK domain-containing protein 1 n=2 Tax=Acanthoscelides obtectus TaxID=200917 RepID=A0A9P0KHN0_ACAOB|nr:unnamed protein product [Acanthoscelides obtectus]CAK1664985.1 DDRGK domain-containing protein 1 [Acanthoscelides obtectus]
MDITILLALASAIGLVIICLAVYLKLGKNEKAPERPRPVANRVRDGAPRRAQMLRNRGARQRVNVAVDVADQQEVHAEEAEQDVDNDTVDVAEGKIGAKKRAKLEAKAEKKAAREAEEQLRAEKKKRQELAENERRQADEKEKLEEKMREEAEKKAKEEQERKEYEEYLKMKEAFSIEEEGYEEGEQEEEQNLLQKFVEYIKNNKVVVIEDLAAHFKLKTQAAIDRIKDLQKDDILTGVIDDRGKFIYVCPEEMEAVAKFIRQRGRVSISELVENSNKLINLMPSTT